MSAPIAVVTGGIRGIGAAAAALLVADGYEVLALDRTDPKDALPKGVRAARALEFGAEGPRETPLGAGGLAFPTAAEVGLLAAPPAHRRVPAIAQRLASCADSFLGAALHDWVAIDPACDVRDDPGEALHALVAAQLQPQAEGPDVAAPGASAWRVPAAAAHGAMNLN